jgi:hypothetical protein
MKIINLLLCFLLGIFIHIFLNIEGFGETICVPNDKSKNCSNAYENICKKTCSSQLRSGSADGCEPSKNYSGFNYCKIDKTKTDDCCIVGKPGLCPGSLRVLNDIEKSSTTIKKTPYTQYIINFSRIPPTSNCVTQTKNSINLRNNIKNLNENENENIFTDQSSTQSVYFIKPDNKSNEPIPFIMYFEFINSSGCFEQYTPNTGYGGMIRAQLMPANPGTQFNTLQNTMSIYENCIDNGIGIIIVPDYIYDIRYFKNCSGLSGFGSPGGDKNCDTNLCWDNGNNPDMYLINQILFNIKNYNIPSKTADNPCKWSPNNNNNNTIYNMDILPNMEYINFDLNNMGIMGYSVGAHFVSRLKKEWIDLDIWKIINAGKSLSAPPLKLAIMIAGASYHCYRKTADGVFIDAKGNPIEDINGCWPSKLVDINTQTYLENTYYSTQNCISSRENGPCFNTSVLLPPKFKASHNICGADCYCGPSIKSNRGCCPYNGSGANAYKIAGDVESNLKLPTILLDTQCDSWADPNATIYYKDTYANNKDVILLPSSLSGDVVHGLVYNQVDILNELILHYIFNPKENDKRDNIINKIKKPDPLPPPPPSPPKYDCDASSTKCHMSPDGPFDSLQDCELVSICS